MVLVMAVNLLTQLKYLIIAHPEIFFKFSEIFFKSSGKFLFQFLFQFLKTSGLYARQLLECYIIAFDSHIDAIMNSFDDFVNFFRRLLNPKEDIIIKPAIRSIGDDDFSDFIYKRSYIVRYEPIYEYGSTEKKYIPAIAFGVFFVFCFFMCN
jgi:hypothetical protein